MKPDAPTVLVVRATLNLDAWDPEAELHGGIIGFATEAEADGFILDHWQMLVGAGKAEPWKGDSIPFGTPCMGMVKVRLVKDRVGFWKLRS